MTIRIAEVIENKKSWYILMLVTFILGVGWTLLSRIPASQTTGGAPPPNPKEGFSAPNFSLDVLTEDGSGEKISLTDYRGQVVMINFWATWCSPCREEMPAMQAVYDDYQDDGLIVLAVNTTFQDNELDVKDFVREFNLSFPVLFDRSGDVSQQYQLRGLPSTYFVDQRGIIQAVIVGGPMKESMMRSRVEIMLKEIR